MARILIVEDNEMNRDMLSRRLEAVGYEVVVAANGANGMQVAEESHPNLIIMDMSLPVLDGWELTRQLKASPTTEQIPVLALTAHAMLGDRNRCLEAGCDDYDTKPVKIERLLEKIELLLSRTGAD